MERPMAAADSPALNNITIEGYGYVNGHLDDFTYLKAVVRDNAIREEKPPQGGLRILFFSLCKIVL